MRALVQRVSRASVDVDGEQGRSIGPGLLVLLGITHDDTRPADRLADKVRALRVFPDAEGRMNEALGDREVLACRSSRSTATRARATARLRPRRAPRAGRAALRALLRAAGRRARRVRRPHGRRARQRRPRDVAARGAVGCRPHAARGSLRRALRRRAAAGPAPRRQWADTLQAEFLAACLRIDTEGTELGDAGSMTWFPDRTWAGRTFVPVTTPHQHGLDLFGYVSFTPGDRRRRARTTSTRAADFTDETADANPEWKMDLCEEVIGGWRGEGGRGGGDDARVGRADRPRRRERHGRAGRRHRRPVRVAENRFTLLAPDAYRGDYLEIALWDDSAARSSPASRSTRTTASRGPVAVPVAGDASRGRRARSRAPARA